MSTAPRRRRAAHLLFAASFVLGGLALVGPLLPSGAEAADDVAVTRSVTATRTALDAEGDETTISSDRVTLRVSQTSDLRGRQEIRVSWDGAHPTGGIVADTHSSDGRNQEYPVVLLQCRGVDTTGAVPKGQSRLSPQTCWTGTSTERYLAGSSTPPWRFDRYARAADRAPVVGVPEPLPAECAKLSDPLTARWLPMLAADGTTYPGGPDPGAGCVSLAPESDNGETGGLPSNTTYGVTDLDGTGETDFSVWTSVENGTLGCSETVACSLVAVPIVGVSCDAFGTRLPAGSPQTTKAGTPLSPAQLAAADATCRRTGAYAPGELRSSTSSDLAVRGQLWWSESNWRNRITVPLDFAVSGSVCDAATEAPEEILGSVLLNELTASWRPRFCTDDELFPFAHIQQSDALARSLVQTGEIDAAFSTVTPAGGFGRPVVQAPTAFGGFAIAFSIDDAERRRRTRLQLDARLVAKLLTSSYPALAVIKNNHPSIGGNPYNLTLDPEFQALNPGLPATTNLESAAALQITSASSDMLSALTAWIDADPEARAWLDGTPDPWGMTVNESYRGIDLPVDNWPLSDPWVAPESYQAQNACYRSSPTPFLQLVLNPLASLSSVLVNMQYASSAVQTVCNYNGYDDTTLPLRQQGRQVVGYRFVLGLVSLSAAERYNLDTAELQTASSVPAGTPFVDATGRTFVAGDAAGLRAAAALLEPDTAARTWALDYPSLSTPAGATAYPGAMPVYTVVPTSGLEPASATKVAKLLCYADGDGQVLGTANGQLPAGYLPLTRDNGLGAERAYLRTAIAAVRAQDGSTPALGAVSPQHDVVCDFSGRGAVATPTPTPSPDPGPDAVVPGQEPGTVPGDVLPVVPGAPPASGVPSATTPTTPPSAGTATQEAAPMLTSGETSLFGRLGPSGLLVLALATALAGSLTRWYDVVAATAAGLGRSARSARSGRSARSVRGVRRR